MSTRTASLRVRVTADELAQLKNLAAAEQRTVSNLVWIAIREMLKARERSAT